MQFVEKIYSIIQVPICVFEIFMIYKYIYGFSIKKVKKLILFFILVSFLITIFMLKVKDGTELALDVSILLCMVVFYFSVPKKRIRQILWIIPTVVSGTVPGSMIWIFLRIFNNDFVGLPINAIFSVSWDLSLLICFLILYHMDDKYHYTRYIAANERFSISITSLFVVTVLMVLYEVNIFSIFKEYTLITVLAIWIGLVLSLWFMIKMIMKGTNAYHYMEISKTNEKIIEIEMQHFEVYKKGQEEIKKLRHDIKNHLACMKILLDKGKEDELKNYLEDMIDGVSGLSPDFQTNIDIVDAIISSKYKEAKENNILIQVDGELASAKNVKAIDWCKIFANAIDNGIEALKEVENKENKILDINIKKNSNFVLIQFENCCPNYVKVSNGKVNSTKKDLDNHGYGLDNIKSALNNYKGDMNLYCQEKDGVFYFTTEILIPIKEEVNSSHI